MHSEIEVLAPGSEHEAVQRFGDGRDVTVLAGGTIVMPALTAGRLRPRTVLMLAHAGMDAVERDGATLRIGAAATLARLADAPEPLGAAVRHVADAEIRAQATLGGNLCAPPGAEAPRGDLQAPLIALGARVRSAGAGGERTEPVEDFLADDAPRLVLEVEFEPAERAGYAALARRHAHGYTALAVACAGSAGTLRMAAGGLGPHAVALDAAALGAARGADDAIASAWYRERVLGVLVRRATEAAACG
jgi:carbon-monoxide dehydrogenase medium subunit